MNQPTPAATSPAPILPADFNDPAQLPRKRAAIPGHWIIWKRIGHGRIQLEEHYCQAIRGGTIAELITDPPYTASPTHPRLEILADMEIHALATPAQRQAELITRAPLPTPRPAL